MAKPIEKKILIGIPVIIVIIIIISLFTPASKAEQIEVALINEDTEKALEIIDHSTVRQLNKPQHSAIVEKVLCMLEAGGADYPIIEASFHHNPEVVDALIAKGVDVNVVNQVLDYTALTEALDSFPREENYIIAESLIDAGADVDFVDFRGQKPIDYALLKDDEVLNNPKLQEARKKVIISIANHSNASDYRYILDRLEEKNEWDIIEELKL